MTLTLHRKCGNGQIRRKKLEVVCQDSATMLKSLHGSLIIQIYKIEDYPLQKMTPIKQLISYKQYESEKDYERPSASYMEKRPCSLYNRNDVCMAVLLEISTDMVGPLTNVEGYVINIQ